MQQTKKITEMGRGHLEIMSAGTHAQYSPVETNLHTTRRGILAFPALQKLSKISQQKASVITKERVWVKKSANFPKMNAIQTDENSFLMNSPTVIEKVEPTISKCYSSMRACAWDDIVPSISTDFGFLFSL